MELDSLLSLPTYNLIELSNQIQNLDTNTSPHMIFAVMLTRADELELDYNEDLMPEFCSECYKENKAEFFSINLYKLASNIKHGETLGFICESCDRQGLVLLPDGQIVMVREGGSDIIKLVDLEFSKDLKKWWLWNSQN